MLSDNAEPSEEFIDTYFCVHCGKLDSQPDYYGDCIAYIRRGNDHLKSEISKSHRWRLMDAQQFVCEYCGMSPGTESFCKNPGLLFNRNHNFLTAEEIAVKKLNYQKEIALAKNKKLKSYGIDLPQLESIVGENRQLIQRYIAKELVGRDLTLLTSILVTALKKSCMTGVHCKSLCLEKDVPFLKLLLNKQEDEVVGTKNLLSEFGSTFGKYKYQTDYLIFESINGRVKLAKIILTSRLKDEKNARIVYLMDNRAEFEVSNAFLDEIVKQIDLNGVKQIVWVSTGVLNVETKAHTKVRFIDIEVLSSILFELEVGLKPVFKVYEPDPDFFNPITY